jgi:hypothetical protein
MSKQPKSKKKQESSDNYTIEDVLGMTDGELDKVTSPELQKIFKIFRLKFEKGNIKEMKAMIKKERKNYINNMKLEDLMKFNENTLKDIGNILEMRNYSYRTKLELANLIYKQTHPAPKKSGPVVKASTQGGIQQSNSSKPPTIPKKLQNAEEPPNTLEVNDKFFEDTSYRGKCFDETNKNLWANSTVGQDPIAFYKIKDKIYLYKDRDNDSYYCLTEEEVKDGEDLKLPENTATTVLDLIKSVKSDKAYFNQDECKVEYNYSHKITQIENEKVVEFFNKFFGNWTPKDQELDVDSKKETVDRPWKITDDLKSSVVNKLNYQNPRLDIIDLINLVILSTKDKDEIDKVIRQRINTKYVCLYYKNWYVQNREIKLKDYRKEVKGGNNVYELLQPNDQHSKWIDRLKLLRGYVDTIGPLPIQLIYSLSRLYYYQIFNNRLYTKDKNLGNIDYYNKELKFCNLERFSLTEDDLIVIKGLLDMLRNFYNISLLPPYLETNLYNNSRYQVTEQEFIESIPRILEDLEYVPGKENIDDLNTLNYPCIPSEGRDYPDVGYRQFQDRRFYYSTELFPFGYLRFPNESRDKPYYIFTNSKQTQGIQLSNLEIPEEGIAYPELGYTQFQDERFYYPTGLQPYGYLEFPNGSYPFRIFRDEYKKSYFNVRELESLKELERKEEERERERKRKRQKDEYDDQRNKKRSKNSISRDRGRERDRSRDRGRDRERDRSRSRDRGRDRERDRSRSRDRERDRGRDRERDRSRSRDRERDRGRDRERDRSRSRDRG